MTYTVLQSEISEVRRKVNEPTTTTYTDVLISGFLVAYSGDVNGVAGEIWLEKASAILEDAYDFSVDNGDYSYNQKYKNYLEQAHFYNSRRKPRTSLWVKSPDEDDDDTDL